jgi:MbtH protein
MNNDAEDKRLYKVVMNDEEQYSIWPAGSAIPLGWYDVGRTGMKQECLAFINQVWTDMRPLSLRRKMTQTGNGHLAGLIANREQL